MRIICGVDVSKAWLDAWIAPDRYRRFANTAEGMVALAGFCREHRAALVVMEASGGVEQEAFLALSRHGLLCAIANPAAVRHFARAMGYLEKTDRIDAAMIAGFAKAKRIEPTPPPSQDQQKLVALATRLRQVSADLGVQKQRLASTRDDGARDSLHEAISFFTRQAKTLAAEIAALVQTDPLWRELDRTLRSVKGVADRTVAVLLADLPEIGTLSNKAVAKITGLAPLANDSGTRQGKRPVRGGAPSSSSSPTSHASSTHRSPTSGSDCSIRANPKWSSASPSPTNSSSGSTPKHATQEPLLLTPFDNPDSRSVRLRLPPPPGGGG